MLSPHQSKDIKLLIGFLVFQGSKLITLELKSRWGGGFLSSSLPNHDPKSLEEMKSKNKTKNQGQTTLARVRAQK